MILLNKKHTLSVYLFRTIVLSSFLLFQCYKSFSQDFYDYSHSLQFASFLYETHQYQLAAEEYERVVFINPNDSTAKLHLVKSYRLAGNNEKALNRISLLCKDNPENLSSDFAAEYVRLLINSGQPDASYAYLQTNKTIDQNHLYLFRLGSLALANRWKEANIMAKQITNLNYTPVHSMGNIINEYNRSRFKSPLLASGMSAILPGTGKFYTGNWKDGMASMLFFSLNAWQTYRAFHKYGINSIYGWVFGTISVGFYSANIYGSYKSAVKFNKKIIHRLHEKTMLLLDTAE